MSENSGHAVAGGPVPEITHRRLLIEMAAVVIAGAIAAASVFSARAGWAVIVGGLVSFLNYFWLRRSTRAIFDRALANEPARFLAVTYFLRYAALGLVLGAIYFTGVLPMGAVIFGVAAFAFAVVIDGLIGIFTGFFRKEA